MKSDVDIKSIDDVDKKKGILLLFYLYGTMKLKCQFYFKFSSLRFSQYYIFNK